MKQDEINTHLFLCCLSIMTIALTRKAFNQRLVMRCVADVLQCNTGNTKIDSKVGHAVFCCRGKGGGGLKVLVGNCYGVCRPTVYTHQCGLNATQHASCY